MNRLDESLNYAKACQDVIDLYGDDFCRGCASIELIKVPVQLHPMLHGIRDLAFDITEAFRDPEDDEYYWADIRQSVKNFMDYRVEP